MTLLAAIIFSAALGCATFTIWDAAVRVKRRGALSFPATTWIIMTTVVVASGLLVLIWTMPRVPTRAGGLLRYITGALL